MKGMPHVAQGNNNRPPRRISKLVYLRRKHLSLAEKLPVPRGGRGAHQEATCNFLQSA